MENEPTSRNRWISWDPYPNQTLVCAAAMTVGLFIGVFGYIALGVYILTIMALACYIRPQNSPAPNEKRNAMIPSRREAFEGLALSVILLTALIAFVAFNAFVLCPLGVCIDWW